MKRLSLRQESRVLTCLQAYNQSCLQPYNQRSDYVRKIEPVANWLIKSAKEPTEELHYIPSPENSLLYISQKRKAYIV